MQFGGSEHMATTGILRSRRSAAQLHALASVEREIRANDHGSGRKYLRDFREAYTSYERVLDWGGVSRAIQQAGIVLVGDYHALPNSQRYLASLIRNPELRRPVVLGVETIFSRDQHIVDEWSRGEIDERELRQRIRFELDWGYEWAPFYELLCAARDRGATIYGLDCMPREDLRKIGARDRHATEKIAEIHQRHPDALVFVLFGESHFAPTHIPALLRERLPDQRVLTVLQNVDSLYWHAAGETSDHVQAVQVNANVVCVFNATPLEKYENYRLCLDRWSRDQDDEPDVAPTVYNLIDGLVSFLGINRYSPHNTTQPLLLVDAMPEVYSRNSDALLRSLLSRKGFSADQRRSVLGRVKEHGSAYLAPLNAMYVRQFRMMSAAEDAARFLHHACRGLPHRVNGHVPAPLPSEDAFYVAVVEHALAWFGSRILHPARPAFRDADLAELEELTYEDLQRQTGLIFADADSALLFLTAHREYDRKDRKSAAVPEWLARGFTFAGRKYEFVVEKLGCLLGNDIYDGYIDGKLTPAALRKLFLAHIDEPAVAREAYSKLTARLL
jgi:hypothetical protein